MSGAMVTYCVGSSSNVEQLSEAINMPTMGTHSIARVRRFALYDGRTIEEHWLADGTLVGRYVVLVDARGVDRALVRNEGAPSGKP